MSVRFIAELGMNHNGNFDLVFELMRQAKWAGADIVKLQLGWRDGPGEMNRIQKGDIERFRRWADHLETELMFSIISRDAWTTLRDMGFLRYKIASRTVRDDLELVEEIAAQGRETIVSLGMWEGEGLPLGKRDNVRYLWCKSKYPAEPWDVVDLPKSFTDSPYDGYSDHTLGIETVLIAVTRGAGIIEKHFTLDKSDTTIRDHALSATPDEFALMTRLGREIHRKVALGV